MPVRMYNGVPVESEASDISTPIVGQLQELQNAVAQLQQAISQLLYPNAPNGYRVLDIDLGTARTASLVADNVVSLTIADITPGATASIILFAPDNDPIIVPNDLGVGSSITNIEPANLYVSNPAQTGSSLKLIVLTRI